MWSHVTHQPCAQPFCPLKPLVAGNGDTIHPQCGVCELAVLARQSSPRPSSPRPSTHKFPLPQVPDWVNATIDGKPASDVIKDEEWFRNSFTPVVATRGGALIKKWGRSSAASTAVSIADAIRALVTPTAENDCFSSGVISDGNPYGVPDGINCSFPLRSTGDGSWEFVRTHPHPFPVDANPSPWLVNAPTIYCACAMNVGSSCSTASDHQMR